jgi:glycine cleavage system aminomethyltransferase T
MAYLAREVSAPGETVDVVTRGHAVPARVTARPMYRNGSVRSPKPRRPE